MYDVEAPSENREVFEPERKKKSEKDKDSLIKIENELGKSSSRGKNKVDDEKKFNKIKTEEVDDDEEIEESDGEKGKNTEFSSEYEDDDEVEEDEGESEYSDIEEENVDGKDRFYPGDLVVLRNKNPNDWNVQYGTVVGLYNRKDPDELADSDKYFAGATSGFYVQWDSTHKVRKVKGEEVGLVDRLLLRGQRVQNQDKMAGTVIDYRVNSTLQIVGTNHVIDEVSVNELRPITSFVRGQEVLYKDWIGVISAVKKNIWYKLDGGLTFYSSVYENDGFVKNDPYWGLGVACPGIKVGLTQRVLKRAKWNSNIMKWFWKWVPGITWIYSMSQGTIIRVEVTGLKIEWISPNPIKPNAKMPILDLISGSELRSIEVIGQPSVDTVGINSVRIYKVKEDDKVTSYTSWFQHFKGRFMGDAANPSAKYDTDSAIKNKALDSELDIPVKVLLKQHYSRIAWDNGNKEWVNASSIPIILQEIEDDDFKTGMLVALVYANNEEDKKKYGIVQESENLVKKNTKTVFVKWILRENGSGYSSETNEIGISEESVYDLKPHPIYSLYMRGTVILSKNPKKDKYASGIVQDLDFLQGKMIISCSDRITRTVYPDSVIPFNKRSHWNFFKRKWIIEELLPPPHQLKIENKNLNLDGEVEMEFSQNNLEKTVEETLWEKPTFELELDAPDNHHYIDTISFDYEFDHDFKKRILNEHAALKANIPEGIWVKAFEDRLDLFSVLMVGPANTPYEDTLFFFDLQVTKDFPKKIPRVHYISYAYEISPFLSEDGNFCVNHFSWDFSKEERPASYLADFLKQMQITVFHAEPYFGDSSDYPENEEDKEYSRSYNEMVFLHCLESSYNMVLRPIKQWDKHIFDHNSSMLPEKFNMIEKWLAFTETQARKERSGSLESSMIDIPKTPLYPLLPISKGFRVALLDRIERIHAILPPGVAVNFDTISIALSKDSATDLKMEQQFSKTMRNGRYETYPIGKDAEKPRRKDHKIELIVDGAENLQKTIQT